MFYSKYFDMQDEVITSCCRCSRRGGALTFASAHMFMLDTSLIINLSILDANLDSFSTAYYWIRRKLLLRHMIDSFSSFETDENLTHNF